MKVTVVGAGNVGATCADVIAQKDFVHEVVLLDIKEGTAEGKSPISGKRPQSIYMILAQSDQQTIIPRQPILMWL